MTRFRGFILGNVLCSLCLATCAFEELMIRRDRNSASRFHRALKRDTIVPISEDMLMELNPVLETADTNNKDSLLQLQKLISDQDKPRIVISESDLERHRDHFEATRQEQDAIRATEFLEDIPNENGLERNNNDMRSLVYNDDGTPKNSDTDDMHPLMERFYLSKIYEDPEHYETTQNKNSRQIAPSPDVVEYIRSNVFVQNGGISLNGDRLKRNQNACGGSNAKASCDSNEVTSSESTPHNDVSVQVALQVLTDLVKERADNRRVQAKQAAEQAHIDRTLDKLYKMG